MKQFFLFILLLICSSAHADDLIHCPERIECTNQHCDFEQDENQYWSQISNLCDSQGVHDGQYKVSYVSAPYRVEDGGYAICVYTHTEVHQTLMLRARLDARLVIFEDETTDWRHEESWGECRPKQVGDCPLRQDQISFQNEYSRSSLHHRPDM